MSNASAIVWFRRDLRLADHVALDRAARESERVVCAFVLDPDLLRGDEMGSPIVAFFFDALAELRAALRERGGELVLLEGDFATELLALAERTGADALYFNEDFEPVTIERDRRVRAAFEATGRRVRAFLDHVYYGPDEVRKPDGDPYTVFTPYKRRWLERFEREPRAPLPFGAALARKLAAPDAGGGARAVPEPEAFGHHRASGYPRGGERRANEVLSAFVSAHIGEYERARNFPAEDATSHLSPHLRAGTIGIRTCVAAAMDARHGARGTRATGIDTWLSELIWRDFYVAILAAFPHVAREPFVDAARGIAWRRSRTDWEAWCRGRTGYPIVDAAMTQLNTSGWMHNRLRMIVASFLTKHLLIDYRWGEKYFARHLADYDLAANNGGWQWASSTGTDAAPYFRIFNPILQSEKFDPEGRFLKAMLPALAKLPAKAVHAPWTLTPIEAESLVFRLGRDYPEPIVDHAFARNRALDAYAAVMGKRARE